MSPVAMQKPYLQFEGVQRSPEGPGKLWEFGCKYRLPCDFFYHFNEVAIMGHHAAGHDDFFRQGVHFQNTFDDGKNS